MTQVKVIVTKTRVYTTFYKTIHATEEYAREHGTGYECDRYNDETTNICRTVAFNLATTSFGCKCEYVDMSETEVTDKDIFDYLDRCHPKG